MRFLAVAADPAFSAPVLTRLVKVRVYLSILAILFSGPLFIYLPLVELFLQEFAARFGVFLIIIAFWEVLLRFITRFIIAGPKGGHRVRRAFWWLLAFLLSMGIFYWAGHLEEKVSEEFFLGMVGLLGLRGLAQGLSIAGYFNLSFAAMMLYLFGLSTFSAALTAAIWQWPFLLIALSMQMGLHAQRHLQTIKINIISLFQTGCEETLKNSKAEKGTAAARTEVDLSLNNIVIFSRLHAFSLILAPVLICMLQYAGLLPKSYLICLLSVALILRSAEFSRKLEKGLSIGEEEYLACFSKMQQFSCYSTIVFFICVTLAGFVEF